MDGEGQCSLHCLHGRGFRWALGGAAGRRVKVRLRLVGEYRIRWRLWLKSMTLALLPHPRLSKHSSIVSLALGILRIVVKSLETPPAFVNLPLHCGRSEGGVVCR